MKYGRRVHFLLPALVLLCEHIVPLRTKGRLDRNMGVPGILLCWSCGPRGCDEETCLLSLFRIFYVKLYSSMSALCPANILFAYTGNSQVYSNIQTKHWYRLLSVPLEGQQVVALAFFLMCKNSTWQATRHVHSEVVENQYIYINRCFELWWDQTLVNTLYI